jgi:hypothetical protein
MACGARSELDDMGDRIAYYPPEQSLGGAKTGGAQTTVRNGNTEKIRVPNPVNDPRKSELQVLDPARLLTLSPADFRPGEEGRNWVISLRAIWPKTFDLAKISPVVARVSYGQGGSSQTVLIDAGNSVFAVPGDEVTVEVGYLSQPDTNTTAYEYQPGVQVTGTAVRSSFVPESAPRLTVPFDSVGVDIRIPSMARYWTLYPESQVAAGDLPYNVDIQSGAFVVETPIPEVIASMARMHQYRALPSSAWRMIVTPTDIPWRKGQVEFTLSL